MEENKTVNCVCKKCGKEFTAPKVYDYCLDCSNEVVETRKCRQCGKEFKVKFGEAQFYEAANLVLPSRCRKCRNERKAARNKKKSN